LQRAAAMQGIDERLTSLENQALEIAKAPGQIAEALNDELKALQSENLELRTLIHQMEGSSFRVDEAD